MSIQQPIELYYRPLAPNPLKVLIVLEELRLPYRAVHVPLDELKRPAYEELCLNGRVPTMVDPNTSTTLWESCAIVLYLIETYDATNKLSYETAPERHQQQQWLHFQSSGQGPYFGQMSWFLNWHAEALPSARDRYVAETHRLVRVLDRHLDGRDWLVGDRCTFADLVFFPWNDLIDLCLVQWGKREFDWDVYPNFKRWHAAIRARPAVQAALEKREEESFEKLTFA